MGGQHTSRLCVVVFLLALSLDGSLAQVGAKVESTRVEGTQARLQQLVKRMGNVVGEPHEQLSLASKLLQLVSEPKSFMGSLLQVAQIQDFAQTNLLVRKLPEGPLFSQYDRLSWTILKTLRLQMAMFVMQTWTTSSINLMASTTVIYNSIVRASTSRRLCRLVHEKMRSDKFVPSMCEKFLPKLACDAAKDLKWSHDDWNFCLSKEGEWSMRESDLHTLYATFGADSFFTKLFTFMLPLVWSSIGSIATAMIRLQTPCVDRDPRLLMKGQLALFFQPIVQSPRCPNEDGVQTGFADFVEDMGWVEYTCFPGRHLVGPQRRQVLQIDIATASLEDTMPDCVLNDPTSPEANKGSEEPVGSTTSLKSPYALPTGPDTLCLTNGGGPAIAGVAAVLLLAYFSNMHDSFAQNKHMLQEYVTHRILAGKQVDPELINKPLTWHSVFYVSNFPILHGGTAIRFGFKERLLSPMEKFLTKLDFGVQFITFFLMVMSQLISAAVAGLAFQHKTNELINSVMYIP